MKIAFVWEDIYRYPDGWKDGLWLALKHIEKDAEVKYFSPTQIVEIGEYSPDIMIVWGAMAGYYMPQLKELPFKKALCFGGGPIDAQGCAGWDLVFTESKSDEDILSWLRVPYLRAFGINEEIFKPQRLKKEYSGMIAGTFALWKRHDLFAQATGGGGIAIGIVQKHEIECYNVCKTYGNTVLEEQPREKIAEIINKSHTVVNTANLWGGGQRLTLEAMACNVPPIVMKDSPKNCEFSHESGIGVIVEPSVEQIRWAIGSLRGKHCNGREYIESKWTSRHYADALKKGIELVLGPTQR
jgi:glycosyltransferase involved in cell wall biosynthesis